MYASCKLTMMLMPLDQTCQYFNNSMLYAVVCRRTTASTRARAGFARICCATSTQNCTATHATSARLIITPARRATQSATCVRSSHPSSSSLLPLPFSCEFISCNLNKAVCSNKAPTTQECTPPASMQAQGSMHFVCVSVFVHCVHHHHELTVARESSIPTPWHAQTYNLVFVCLCMYREPLYATRQYIITHFNYNDTRWIICMAAQCAFDAHSALRQRGTHTRSHNRANCPSGALCTTNAYTQQMTGHTPVSPFRAARTHLARRAVLKIAPANNKYTCIYNNKVHICSAYMNIHTLNAPARFAPSDEIVTAVHFTKS